MTPGRTNGGPADDAVLCAALFAVDPRGLGGVHLRAGAGAIRDRWLELLLAALPEGTPVRKLPLHVHDDRLEGGLDLAATLQSGRPVARRGLLAEADGGVVLVSMAERVDPSVAARLGAVLDRSETFAARDGVALRSPARIGIVLLDEGADDDERPPHALVDRVALATGLEGIRAQDLCGSVEMRRVVCAARERLPQVRASDAIVEAICAATCALGIASARAPLFALRAARASAALAGRLQVGEDDLAAAGRIVLAPRATCLPAADPADRADALPDDESHDDDRSAPRHDDASQRDNDAGGDAGSLADVVSEAAKAVIPAGLLAQLKSGVATRSRSTGTSGAFRRSGLRGAPAGVRAGTPGSGARLALVATLRAAAPWQRLRAVTDPGKARRIIVRREDLRVMHYRQRSEATTIFVVDASGSSALHRMAEAKGAVERLLAECYVRRDRVAVLAFRGDAAQTLLPPTRSLVRAKRSLARLPGGGGTPLAAGLDAAAALTDAVTRRGGTPSVVLLTDGGANVARDRSPGRARAVKDALDAAAKLRALRVATLVIDTSPRAQPAARRLADTLGARYVALPYADAGVLAAAVRFASRGSDA